MSRNLLTLAIDGREIQAVPDSSIIQAYAPAGNAITANVGCMGQGVCGSPAAAWCAKKTNATLPPPWHAKPKSNKVCRSVFWIISFPNTSNITT